MITNRNIHSTISKINPSQTLNKDKNSNDTNHNHVIDNTKDNNTHIQQKKIAFIIPYRDSYEYVYISEKIKSMNTKLNNNEKIKHIQKYVSLKDKNQHSLMDIFQSYKGHLRNNRKSVSTTKNPHNPYNYAIQIQCHKKTKHILELLLKSYHIHIYPTCKELMCDMIKNEIITIQT